ncbi:MAG: hypothetical protein OEZ13_09460 [Spirochaetia bacterium]|nr:hypothetical protein [Spirochaetia bacterium]
MHLNYMNKKNSFNGICVLYITFIYFFAFACAGKQIIYQERSKEVQDNLWIDKTTLQISVQEDAKDYQDTYVERREKSCNKAYQKVMPKFHDLYKNAENIHPQIEVYHKLYLENGGCRLIVRLSAEELKRFYNGQTE